MEALINRLKAITMTITMILTSEHYILVTKNHVNAYISDEEAKNCNDCTFHKIANIIIEREGKNNVS